MSGKETVRTLRDERDEELAGLRSNELGAQKAMRAAGYSVADHDTPLDMVKKLIVRNQQQQGLADGLRERVKAAVGSCSDAYDRIQAMIRAASFDSPALADLLAELLRSLNDMPSAKKADDAQDVYGVNTDLGTECPFHITVGGCNARRSEENGDWHPCARDPEWRSCPPGLGFPCRLDEGPILVKKAE